MSEPELTPEQEKAFIEAITDAYSGWVDAYEQHFDGPEDERVGRAIFLAGVRWALGQVETQVDEYYAANECAMPPQEWRDILAGVSGEA